MRAGEILSVIFLLALALTGPAFGERRTIEDELVIVRFDSPLESAAKEVLRDYPAVRAELMKDLGWKTEFRPEIVLVKDNASFRLGVESALVTAFAVPRKDLIVIDYSRMNVQPFTLGITLKHELCHLELHHRVGEGRLPRWLDEGICQWVTGGLAEIMTDGKRPVLREAILSKRLMSIGRLTEDFPTDGKELVLAYEESRSLVEYIRKEFGVSGLLNIVEQMRGGDQPEDAIRKSLQISTDELEKRWRASLARRIWWFSYISDNLYEILFLLAAVITIYGFFRILRKRREYRDEDEEENEGKP